ncbi:hypothetical protein [Mesorhizobium sp. DCY119]|uniref:hypothetical protein n=1 Tax=Mesorhizobium sp. DCY119 TaxID=2108445 RepID=UPI000E74980F|nr:hypothetical protein [Mesorhizobium sp. DCY119]RJG40799.1 hypothetical protein D3Y55_26565 [Mesorhizobium sp. DCY119]
MKIDRVKLEIALADLRFAAFRIIGAIAPKYREIAFRLERRDRRSDGRIMAALPKGASAEAVTKLEVKVPRNFNPND